MTLQVPGESVPRVDVISFAYDVFIVHAAADEWFVEGYLVAKLGLDPERVLVPRALELGQLIISEIERGVRSSRVTIVVLSSAYMTDHWAELGKQIATYASIAKDVHGVLLPLLLEDCELSTHIRALVKLDFRNPARELWAAETERLRQYLDRLPASEPDLPCPYPGMRPFTARDAPRFFGRDTELDDLIGRLQRGDRAIYVIGASGSGKSSLIVAGLVPRLDQRLSGLPRFHVRTFRPGEQPLTQLADALEGDSAALATAVGPLLARHAPAASLLLVIDQLEELFAITCADERRGFFAAIRVLRADPRCVLVFTLRSDFYGAFLECPLWTDVAGQISRIELGALRSDSLQLVIERPARDLGVYVQPELVSRLLADAAREPGALPLLQAALFRLWGKRRQRLLALPDYQALGDGARTGLAFAISEHAKEVLDGLPRAQEAIALRILLRLVNFGEGRADTRRQQPLAALRSEGEASESFEAVLQRLVDFRLVTVTSDKHGPVRVDLAHEILIHAWSTLAEWIRAWRTHEHHRRELEAAAAAWRARGSSDGGLLDPVELAGAMAWRTKAAELGHSSDLAAFLAASEAAQVRALRQRRRRTQLVFAAVALFSVVTSTLALVARSNANEAIEQSNQRIQLVAESAQVYQEIGRQRLVEAERPLEALSYLVVARANAEATGHTPSSSLRILFAQATRNLPISAPLHHHDTVWRVAFSPDGTRVVTASWDNTARVWDATSGKPLSPPLKHHKFVMSAAFSPDGTRVVTASQDNTARVWDAASGKPLSPPLEHHAFVFSAAFSPDGTRVITASADYTARVWDAASGKPLLPLLHHQHAVMIASFSSDGTRIVTASGDKTARVWDAASGKPLSPPLPHHELLYSAAFSPDGTRVVTASQDNTARVWDAASGNPLSPPLQHQSVVQSAAFSPDGTRVVTASWDKTARVWDAASGKPLSPPLQHQGGVPSATFSPDGTRVVTASDDGTARIWDAASGNPISPPLQHQGGVLSATFSPDGTRVVTASLDKTARVWDAASETPPSPLRTHQGEVRSAGFSPDGTRVVTASADKTARVWDAASSNPLSPPLQHRGRVTCAAFSPDGARVVTASWDNTARVWDAASGNPISPPLQHQGVVYSVAFSPDGTRVVTASWDNTARVWDAASGNPISPALQHQGVVYSAAFSPDGTRVVTASWDNTARVWDAASGNPISPALQHQRSVNEAVFSPDGTRVVTASNDNTARVWDATSGKPLSGPLAHHNHVVSAVFSLDGTHVVTASDDSTARVWDAASGDPISPPLQHQGRVTSAAFSPDGARIVTASWDNTARVWDAASGTPISPPLKHHSIVLRATFNLDGTRVVTASYDKTERIWDFPLASGDLAEWRSIADRASPYVLTNGVLSLRDSMNDQPTSATPTVSIPSTSAP